MKAMRNPIIALCLLIGGVLVASCATDHGYSGSAGHPAPPAEPDAAARERTRAPLEEELWVIAKSRPDAVAVEGSLAVAESAPTRHSRAAEVGTQRLYAAEGRQGVAPEQDSGGMLASLPDDDGSSGPRLIPLPLQHTEVDAGIAGYIGTVQVRQQFTNPFDTKIEAVYRFPLPEKSAVSEFLMVIGERTIRGIVRETAEAEAIYRQARAQGHRASLLVQHRPNIFEQKVANIEPGNAIDIDITYFHTLVYKDGWYSFVFPTVVGPRYNPPGHPEPVPALPRGGNSRSPGATGVEYLAPTERSAHDLGITVRIDAGVAIEELKSTHEIVVTRDGENTATVQLADASTIPNRDFVLDFRVAGSAVKSNLFAYRNPESGEGYFTLMLIPPLDAAAISRRPMEMIFVIDCSGSMRGRPLDQAREAVATALSRLTPQDRFQIIRFSDSASRFGAAPLPATRRNLAAARSYLAGLDSNGGTQMIEGIRAALDFPGSAGHYRFVAFMTDGFIGNEREILSTVQQRVGTSRIFSFGVGSSVNRYLLERMAKAGRGVAAYLGLNDSAEQVMGNFFDRVSRPALTDIDIEWGAMSVSETYPATLPDLFVGRPLVMAGRFQGEPGVISVTGLANGERRNLTPQAAAPGAAGTSVAKVWARLNIADLADRQAALGDPHGELGNAILRTALAHQLVSGYTSFVAVDSSAPTQGSHGVTVHQAVPVPDGVRYETTVQ